MTILSEDDIAFAGEFVLGLLSPAEEAVAVSRIATDAEFAAEVEAWNMRLQPLLNNKDQEPSPHLWKKISTTLPADSLQDRGTASLRFWQGLTGLSATAAAILAVMAFQPKSSEVSAPTPPSAMVAALGSEAGTSSMTVRYDEQNGEMLMTPVALKTGELFPELWVIPEGGTPHSLGMLRADGPSIVKISQEIKQHIAAGATLAVTSEPINGGPGGKPTGPIIASGKITII